MRFEGVAGPRNSITPNAYEPAFLAISDNSMKRFIYLSRGHTTAAEPRKLTNTRTEGDESRGPFSARFVVCVSVSVGKMRSNH